MLNTASTSCSWSYYHMCKVECLHQYRKDTKMAQVHFSMTLHYFESALNAWYNLVNENRNNQHAMSMA